MHPMSMLRWSYPLTLEDFNRWSKLNRENAVNGIHFNSRSHHFDRLIITLFSTFSDTECRTFPFKSLTHNQGIKQGV